MEESDPTLDRLEDQIDWYDRKSISSQRWFKRLKAFQITAAAGVPVVIALSGPPSVAAVLGGLVAVVEGMQGLNQYQQNWILYRSTCEALRHEKYLYLANAGPYSDERAAHRVLAEKIEGLVSQEHAKWTTAREEPPPSRSEP
jgi:Protein of unknown function (DUF4231)